MIRIQIWADFVCPYSYIGISNLHAAIENLQLPSVHIDYVSCLKYPHVQPHLSQSLALNVSDKYGISEEDAQQYMEEVKGLAQRHQLTMNLEQLKAINTFNAHRLSKLAALYRLQDAFALKLLNAYFVEGISLNDKHQLKRLGESVGLKSAEIEQVLLNSAMFETEVEDDHYNSQRLGVKGTPYFIFNNIVELKGVQTIERFEEVLLQCQSSI